MLNNRLIMLGLALILAGGGLLVFSCLGVGFIPAMAATGAVMMVIGYALERLA